MTDVRVVRKHDKGCRSNLFVSRHRSDVQTLSCLCPDPFCPAEVLVSERAVVQLAEKVMKDE